MPAFPTPPAFLASPFIVSGGPLFFNEQNFQVPTCCVPFLGPLNSCLIDKDTPTTFLNLLYCQCQIPK
uniref:Uncharacterized protein n=1 Tax=Rhizophora mucronata TaxID=61149 RepID=A0A2P2MVG2_RHIMU